MSQGSSQKPPEVAIPALPSTVVAMVTLPRSSQAQLLPALEKVLGRHLRGLEELVDGHWELQGEGLGSTTVPGREE